MESMSQEAVSPPEARLRGRSARGDRPSSRKASRLPLILVVVGVAMVVVALIFVPRDATLGADVRAVFFHGAVTWTAIVLAVAAGLTAVGTLALGWDASSRVWRLLTLATIFWVLSLTLSFPVMRMTWGGVLWNEPKLLMSAEIVSTYLVAWAVSFFAARRIVTVIAALVAVLIMVVLLLTTPAAFHPDNPILRSGDLRFISTFLVTAAGPLCVAAGIVLWPRRVR